MLSNNIAYIEPDNLFTVNENDLRIIRNKVNGKIFEEDLTKLIPNKSNGNNCSNYINFLYDEEEVNGKIVKKLKLTRCLYCNMFGMLNECGTIKNNIPFEKKLTNGNRICIEKINLDQINNNVYKRNDSIKNSIYCRKDFDYYYCNNPIINRLNIELSIKNARSEILNVNLYNVWKCNTLNILKIYSPLSEFTFDNKSINDFLIMLFTYRTYSFILPDIDSNTFTVKKSIKPFTIGNYNCFTNFILSCNNKVVKFNDNKCYGNEFHFNDINLNLIYEYKSNNDFSSCTITNNPCLDTYKNNRICYVSFNVETINLYRNSGCVTLYYSLNFISIFCVFYTNKSFVNEFIKNTDVFNLFKSLFYHKDYELFHNEMIKHNNLKYNDIYEILIKTGIRIRLDSLAYFNYKLKTNNYILNIPI
jgi:hypothetical protein